MATSKPSQRLVLRYSKLKFTLHYEIFVDTIGIFLGYFTRTREYHGSITIDLEHRHPCSLLGLVNNGNMLAELSTHGFEIFTNAITNYLGMLNTTPIPKELTRPFDPDHHDLLPFTFKSGVPDQPEEGNQPAMGQIFTNMTCIHVLWPWLTLPAVLVLAIINFLVALIV